MKKYLKRLTHTHLMILFFIPFGIWGYCRNGWLGFLATVLGWCLGSLIWHKFDAIKNFNAKKFFKKYRVILINLLILIPIDAIAYYIGGWRIFTAITAGWFFGIVIWRIRKGKW